MKLISLNTWGGVLYDELAEFLKKYSGDADIFCLQEIFHNATNLRPIYNEVIPNKGVHPNLFTDISNLLPDFKGYYAHRQDNEEGLAIFVRQNLNIAKVGDIFVYKNINTMIGDDGSTIGINIQFAEIIQNDKPYTIVNFHGMWIGHNKGTDTPERITQSLNTKKFLDKTQGSKIICGDFNLSPDTDSMGILEKNMRNLIKENKITSTRSKYYKKENKFADYILVSPEIMVKDFKVLDDVISDHLPLYLEFEV